MGKVIYSKINVIPQEKGDIFKLLTKDSMHFDKFGEAYYSNIKFNEIKGWKKHLKMQCVLLPVSGDVDVVTLNLDSNRFEKFNLNIKTPHRLVIPPNIIFAFRGNDNNIQWIENSFVYSDNLGFEFEEYYKIADFNTKVLPTDLLKDSLEKKCKSYAQDAFLKLNKKD